MIEPHNKPTILPPGMLLLLMVCMLCCNLIAIAQGKGNEVEVRISSTSMLSTEPGKIVTSTFIVTNNTTAQHEFVESVNLPQGWLAVEQPGSIVMEQNEQRVRILAFLVPSGTHAGTYNISYSVRGLEDTSIQDTDILQVVIESVQNTELVIDDKPDAVIAGDIYTIKAQLINRGNASAVVRLAAESAAGYTVQIESEELSLQSGDSRSVSITVKTTNNTHIAANDSVRVKAEVVCGGTAKILTSQIQVKVIPYISGEQDMSHRIPLKVSFDASSNSGDSTLQTSVSATGSVDEDGTKWVDLLLRGSEPAFNGFYGLRDEYRLNYTTGDFGIKLGDQSYSLSRLTSYYKYGRGLGADFYRSGNFTTGVQFLKAGWGDHTRQELGGYIQHRLGNAYQVKLNYMNRESEGADHPGSVIRSLEVYARPNSNTNLELESADSSIGGRACRLHLDGRAGQVSYLLEKVDADPDYDGYYSDCSITNAAINIPLGEKLRGRVAIRKWKSNLDHDPALPIAPSESLYQLGVRYNLSPDLGLSLDHQTLSRTDMMEQPRYDSRESSIQLGLHRSTSRSNMQAVLSYGQWSDLLSGTTSTTARYSLYYHLRSSQRQYFSLFTQFGNGPRENRLLASGDTLGVSTNWMITDRLALDLQYSLDGLHSSLANRARQLYLDAEYRSTDDRIWRLQARHINRALGGDDTSFMLSYSFDYDIAVAKKTGIGIVSGRVFDTEQQGQPGIPRAIVTIGDASAATNDNGEFCIASLPQGKHWMTVDKRSIGLDKVTQQPLPVEVEVRNGETSTLSVPVVKASNLSGRVRQFGYPSADGNQDVTVSAITLVDDAGKSLTEPVDITGLPGIQIELTDGLETLHTFTDNAGNFIIERIRPGKWILKVSDADLPPFHYIEIPHLEVNLEPGISESVDVKVLPRIRKLRMLAQEN